ncbi:DUF4326 domain-containing protein [Actinomycetospora sp. NBRC 106378]|uniref:DUF4326 domain-containing protein n=1 Tax=Actinomycetospora sp. NBRC 106378 TaxID=3032208 RepID=UPI0024A3AC97|nr:DUF4326 domain-containing protein [Actinomycetospora sp. NBRC 106378]GLZ51074.1 hypothetical protein Acsp07_06910 [Actinomycetospora sp. NBRC 106378]
MRRIQLRRAKGWRKPEEAVTVARPSSWGNPFRLGETVEVGGERVTLDRDLMIALYRRWLVERPELVEKARTELAGHDLACWCAPDEACHADVLLRIAAGGDP